MDNKPTQEELDAQIQAALEVDPTPTIEEDPKPEPTPEVIPVEKEPEVTPEPEKEEEEEEEVPEVKPEPKKEEPDYKIKFAESSREAQVIAHSKKEFEQQIEEAQNLPEPTEDQVKQEFQDYDLLSDFERESAKEMTHSRLIKRAIASITSKQKEAEQKVEERAKQADTFSIDPDMLKKFPKLEGKQEEFKVFATKQTRLTLDLEDAAALFSTTIPESTKHKGQMFETGLGGDTGKQKPKDDKISLSEAAVLQKTDYKKWKEMLVAGKISSEVE